MDYLRGVVLVSIECFNFEISVLVVDNTRCSGSVRRGENCFLEIFKLGGYWDIEIIIFLKNFIIFREL